MDSESGELTLTIRAVRWKVISLEWCWRKKEGLITETWWCTSKSAI